MTVGVSPHTPLAIDALRAACVSRHCGATIHYFETIDSTNTAAHRLAAEGAADGTVVIAETQTRGRGRLGRSWVSPPFRHLYLSIILRPAIAVAAAPQLGLVAGVATAEAVAEWVPRVGIKWPNDVVIDRRKLAGILTEMDADADAIRFVVVGIGVNLNGSAADFPPEIRDKAISLAMVIDASVDRATFASRLLARFEECYAQFIAAGFAALRPQWEARSCLTGHRVEIDDSGRRHVGTVTGIADDGSLLLRDALDKEVKIVVGDVTVLDGYGEREVGR